MRNLSSYCACPRYPGSVTPPVPWIQLKGKWLAKAGFNINTPIKVEVDDGRLVLTTE